MRRSMCYSRLSDWTQRLRSHDAPPRRRSLSLSILNCGTRKKLLVADLAETGLTIFWMLCTEPNQVVCPKIRNNQSMLILVVPPSTRLRSLTFNGILLATFILVSGCRYFHDGPNPGRIAKSPNEINDTLHGVLVCDSEMFESAPHH